MSTLKWILLAVLLVAATLGVLLLLGYLGVAPFDAFLSNVQGYTATFDLPSTFSNPASLVTMAAPAVAVGGAALSKINSTKQQAQETVSTAKSQVNALQSSVSSKTQELESTQLSLKDSDQKIKDLQTQLEAAKASPNNAATIKSLQDQMQGIQDGNSQFVKQLMTAANGALVVNPLDGKTYSVLKVTNTQVK